MNHAIKIENLSRPKEYWDKVSVILKDFLSEMNFIDYRINEIECRSRDGFMPYSSNKGGYQAYAYGSSLDAFIEPTGFKEYDKLCLKTYNEKEKDAIKEANITRKKYEKGIANDDSDMLSIRDDFEMNYCGDYDSSAITMLLKVENDNTIYFYVGIGGQDAPYFRSFESSFDHEITFDSIKELKLKLEALKESDNVKDIQWLLCDKFS